MTDLEQFIGCLKNGSREDCFTLARDMREGDASVTDKYERVLIPALHRIGSEWERNSSSTVDEHFASEIVNDIVAYDAVNIIPETRNGKTVLIGCVPGEFHELAAKMMANRLAESGWTVRYYGSSVPHHDLVARTAAMKPDLLLLSMRSLELLESTLALLRDLRDQCPSVRIMLGGAAGDDVRTVLQPHVDAFADDFAAAALEADRLTSPS
jgi:methanogenic corrinoid protein MtbC1